MRIRPFEAALRWSLRAIKSLDWRDDDSHLLRAAEVRCVLLVSSTALGDTVMSTAAFGPLRQRFPTARFVAVIHESSLQLFRHCAEIDEAVPARSGWHGFLDLAIRLRGYRPDIAVILHGNEPQATPLAYLAGARWIFKLPNARNPFRFLLANRATTVTVGELGHGLDQRLRTAALAGAAVEGARMRLPEVPGASERVEAFFLAADFAPGRRVAMQCGASAASRMWPAGKFVDLGRRLRLAHPDIGVVLTGSPAERAYLDGIARGIGGTATIVTAGELPIECLPALVASCACLVTGDTGTMHVAFALEVPAVCLFAVSDPATSGPPYDHERHVVIHRPCPDLAIRTKSDDARCIARIEVDEVIAAVTGVLARKAG
ncbi:MAG: glycosyltransferase family 9 protein [Sulfurisoma sp.]|nr:glycosyltransferase family 9 protein [Sulfurisoma sp.]